VRTSEMLRAARSRIDAPEKWWQNGTGRGDACACQAVWRTREELDLHQDLSDAADLALARSLGYRGCDVTDARHCVYAYNDDRATTHADIMALYDRAIAAEELEEAFAAPTVAEPTHVEVPT